jgi:hypothetical protein
MIKFLKGTPTRIELIIYILAFAFGGFVGKYLLP